MDALIVPNEEVLKSLRTQYPRPSKGSQPVPKGGGKGKGPGEEKTVKNDWVHQSAKTYPGARGDDWTPPKTTGQRRDGSARSRARERKERDKGGKGRDKDGGRGGTGKGSLDPRVRRIFTISKDKKEGKCP